MHEEMVEKKNETETEAEVDTASERKGLYNFLDGLFVIDSLALYLLKRLNTLGTVSDPGLMAIQKNLNAISENVQELQGCIREHTGEQDTPCYSVLWKRIKRRIKRALKEMLVFK